MRRLKNLLPYLLVALVAFALGWIAARSPRTGQQPDASHGPTVAAPPAFAEVLTPGSRLPDDGTISLPVALGQNELPPRSVALGDGDGLIRVTVLDGERRLYVFVIV